jgi:peptidoglycan/LPS O-acetylase OafA/YrhL
MLPAAPSPPPPRANGLDTLRACAITLVFLYHYKVFVSATPGFGWVSQVGWVGVDLFFVLSGYLIANQLFEGVARGRRLSLTAFYARRALRTLPVFWVVLAAYFLFPADLGGRAPPALWTFLTFTQNLGLQPGTAFSHAWSLCIEEQFYLVVPLAVGAWLKLGRRVPLAWWVLAGLLALGIASRAWLWQAYGRESGGGIDGYYPNIYYATLCRFDEFLPGVAVALLKNFHPDAWARLTRHGQRVLAAGVLATAALLWGVQHFYVIDDYGYGFFMTAFGYSGVAIAFAVLVVAALSEGSWLHRLRVPGAYSLALWSYAIYLSHKAVGVIAKRALAPTEAGPWALFALVTLGSLTVGWALHHGVESPFMAWRQRRFPSNFRPPAEAASAAQPA